MTASILAKAGPLDISSCAFCAMLAAEPPPGGTTSSNLRSFVVLQAWPSANLLEADVLATCDLLRGSNNKKNGSLSENWWRGVGTIPTLGWSLLLDKTRHLLNGILICHDKPSQQILIGTLLCWNKPSRSMFGLSNRPAEDGSSA